jgi:hypothetical protein
MRKQVRYLLCVGLLSHLFFACKKDDEAQPSTEQPLAIAELTGYVQKGPFVIGTNIAVTELDKALVQTGKSFNATIKDDQGAFSLKNLKLNSKYVELRANGYYFNEVTGKLSVSQLSLSALADVTNTGSVNVNLLTHLEKGRVEYLMSNGKQSFEQAKKQAQQEVLAMINITKADIISSEKLNIAQAGEDNAILLAFSVILQSNRSESELSELLSKISLDIQQDGTLDTPALQSALLNEATLLKTEAVKANVTKRYADLGLTVSVEGFEKYVQNFVTKSTYAFTKKIQYPATGQYGDNLLVANFTRFTVPKSANYHWHYAPTCEKSFSLAALAPLGTTLRLKLVVLDKTNRASYFVTEGSWKNINSGQELEIIKTDELTEGKLHVYTNTRDSLTLRIEVYENNTAQPTRVKEIIFSGDSSPSPNDKIEYPAWQSGANANLLNVPYQPYTPLSQASPGKSEHLIALVPANQQLKVRITSTSKPDSSAKFFIRTDFSQDFYFKELSNTWQKTVYSYDGQTEVHEIEAVAGGMVRCDLRPAFEQYSQRTVQYLKSVRIEIFENGASQPNRVVQVINWQ